MLKKLFVAKLNKLAPISKSPLVPKRGGYPIILGNIKPTDLEHDFVPVSYKVNGVQKKGVVMVYNPYVMKGATEIVRNYNSDKEQEINEIADSLSKRPYKQYQSNVDLEKRAKEESDLAFETFMDNERRGSDPAGNPTWIMRAPHQGPERGRAALP